MGRDIGFDVSLPGWGASVKFSHLWDSICPPVQTISDHWVLQEPKHLLS